MPEFSDVDGNTHSTVTIPIYAIVIISILLAGIVACVIALFVLHFQKSSGGGDQGPRGFQGPRGEVGSVGDRGFQGFQGTGTGTGPNFDIVTFGTFTIPRASFGFNPGNFSLHPPEATGVPFQYEILSQRISSTVVRRTCSIKADWLIIALAGANTQLLTFTFTIPANVIGSTLSSSLITYLGSASGTGLVAPPLPTFAPVASCSACAITPTINAGLICNASFCTGSIGSNLWNTVNQVSAFCFECTFWHDDNVPQ